MRPRLATGFGVLLLAIGPVVPYAHLTSAPHHLCPDHGLYERGRHRGRHAAHPRPPLLQGRARGSLAATPLPEPIPAPQDAPGNSRGDHDTCSLANLTLGSTLAPTPMCIAQLPAPVLLPAARLPADVPLATRRHRLALAPKTSPPGARRL